MAGRVVTVWAVAVVAVAGLAGAAGAQPEEYTVQPNDTLYSIARRFGTTVERLVELNGLQDPHRLQVGQRLRVAEGRPAEHPEGATYVVQPKDTLWSIARRYGTTPAQLAAANGLDVDGVLRVGQVLRVPGGETRVLRRTSPLPSRGLAVVSLARRFLGVPYRWGGTGPGGFDCSGFLYAVFRRLGIELPRTSFEMFRSGRPVPREQLQAGDLVFFTTYAPGASHAGIYLGDGRFIHASSAGGRVRIDPLTDPYYRSRYLGARRYF
jgi:D-gamma-glutamyl-meso-diaminopimelic acid endopeptidase CwlS/peptidoglycan endopeptidase LytE